MGLYTIVVDFRGGTYFEQVSAEDLNSAVAEWPSRAPVDAMGLLSTTKSQLLDMVRDPDADPTPLRGLRNVWTVALLLEDSTAFLNIIKTSTDP